MKIGIKNFCLLKTPGSVKASCDVILGKIIIIHQVKIIQGPNGPFINMPTRKIGDAFEPVCTILDENLKKEIRDILLEIYASQQRFL